MPELHNASGEAGVSLPPKDDLIRAVYPGPAIPSVVELREDGESPSPVLSGHFAVFDRWTEIDSHFEGHFMESISHGAFRKTFKENRSTIRALFQHGRDPQIGDKPLGPIKELREEDEGAYYEVPLLDAPYVRNDVLPGLRAGLYGASFRLKVMKEEFKDDSDPSEYNPKGLPERTIKEVQVFEFGPVTFPAYAEASAGVRSLTDDFRLPALRDLAQTLGLNTGAAALLDKEPEAQEDPAPTTPDSQEPQHSPSRDYLQEKEEKPSWLL